MIKAIDDAKSNGDSIGGIVEVIVEGMPIGVGSYVHYDRKLDAKLAAAMMSINAFKGVEIGIGFEAAHRPGSEVHDEIVWNEEHGYTRRTNNAGGLEGGMTTGMPIVVRGVMKPIPTLYKPLQSVDIDTKEPFTASIERSDSCAVPAASVVAEAVVAWELATALIEQFGLDRMALFVKILRDIMNMRGILMGNIHIQTKSKEYDVYVGKESLSHLTTIVQNMKPSVSNIMIISDEAVASLHLQTVVDALQIEQKVFSFVVPSGEKRSPLKISMRLIRQLLKIN